jgi:uncharacterized repeat protein (TIGR04138 family)
MRQDPKFWDAVSGIREKDSRFKPEAYAFLMDALDHTISVVGEHRHVSADELLRGLCDHANQRYGPLALAVVQNWGIHSPSDVGRLVYQLVDAGVLSKQDSDSYDDFDKGRDLKAILEDEYFD